MVVMSVTEMVMSPSQGPGRLVGVSCHTIWYLTVVGGVRAVRDWVIDMLSESYGNFLNEKSEKD